MLLKEFEYEIDRRQKDFPSATTASGHGCGGILGQLEGYLRVLRCALEPAELLPDWYLARGPVRIHKAPPLGSDGQVDVYMLGDSETVRTSGALFKQNAPQIATLAGGSAQ